MTVPSPKGLVITPPPEAVVDFGEAEPTLRSLGPRLTIPERIALDTQGVRKTITYCLTAAFLVINGLVMFGLYRALLFDFKMLASHADYKPFIDHEVIMALLGATTIQLGAVTFTMVKFLFPTTGT
jgi:hypothetical protein